MRTSEVVRERALALAAMGRVDQAAIDELIEASMFKRVSIVMARQELEGGDSEHAAAAASLLDRALAAPVWGDVVNG